MIVGRAEEVRRAYSVRADGEMVHGRIERTALFGALLVLCAGCAPSDRQGLEQHAATLRRYCFDCHSYAEQTANLYLEGRNLERIGDDPEIWERVVRKLRAGMMPPLGQPRPERETAKALAEWLETELDRTTFRALPPPGMHRLNRAEYANAVRDLLGLRIDASQFLPSDDSSRGFDNQAGTLGLSPALLEAYLSAAGKISRLALGAALEPTQTVYRVPADATQNYHVPGLPFGTRGGLLIEHEFPVDGEYVIRVFPVNQGNMGNFEPFGDVRGEQLEVSLDGRRLELVDWDGATARGSGPPGQLRTIDVRVPVAAGSHEVGVAFLATHLAPLLDLNDAFERSTIETGGLPGFTFYPHVGSVRIDGPFAAAGASDTPSRRALFTCRPAAASEERACAEQIIGALARRAYRGMQTPADVARLMAFYDGGRDTGGFEHGIELALQRALSDPKFLYRVENEPDHAAPGALYPLSALELASRLSFFLWSSIPDDELLLLAEAERLTEPATLAEQVDRMLDDPRSTAFTANFAGQWLSLRALDGHVPVTHMFPDFDDNLRDAFRSEMELFFDSLIREDRSVLDLLNADYTFVDERLATHYGIPGIKGSYFRRVTLGEELDARRGLLGKGALLTVWSQPVRTSPVIRGYRVLQDLFGVPPPPPPPDVPDLAPVAPDAAGNAQPPPLRTQLERHRADPACSGCHVLMDPIGFALEPFDAIGQWREEDGGHPIDTTAVMYDGTRIDGPADLRAFLAAYPERFVANLTEKLFTYGLGRGVEHYDLPYVREVLRSTEPDGHRLKDIIAGVARSEAFRMNRKPSGGALDSGG